MAVYPSDIIQIRPQKIQPKTQIRTTTNSFTPICIKILWLIIIINGVQFRRVSALVDGRRDACNANIRVAAVKTTNG